MGLFDLFKKGAGDLDLTGDGLTITAKEKKALIQLLENKARESGNTNLLNVSFAIKNGKTLSPDALELCHICLYGQSLMGSFFSGGDTPPEIEPLTKRIRAYLDAHKEKDPEPQS